MSFSTESGNDIEKAKYWLLCDEAVAIPTETVYGLAANALQASAVIKIFKVKNRPAFDPLIVHVNSAEVIFKYVIEFPSLAQDLCAAFMPGPLTLILPKKDEIPDLVTSGLPKVGIRIPDHPLSLRLLNEINFPLAAPSANPFGYISPTTAEHVLQQLNGKIPYVLDGGPCRVGVESTIIEVVGDEIFVHRLGGIPLESLYKFTSKIQLRLNQSSNPAAPGQLSAHYAPRKQLFFTKNVVLAIEKASGKKIGLITFTDKSINGVQAIPLSETGSLEEAAANLFKVMRILDESDVDLIIAEYFPDEGLGRAINDRLRRASTNDK
ncbi:MAG: L-threonylcarbamoyladenylate synthase [Chitinophagales bacterium]|nr:L-threonylcarbamoyladenylate synthase [Chitinophagales bacterium]MDW8273888.1 L-threonylcarbamoyladenylate synthase [Chitinophagales bacterium]